MTKPSRHYVRTGVLLPWEKYIQDIHIISDKADIRNTIYPTQTTYYTAEDLAVPDVIPSRKYVLTGILEEGEVFVEGCHYVGSTDMHMRNTILNGGGATYYEL